MFLAVESLGKTIKIYPVDPPRSRIRSARCPQIVFIVKLLLLLRSISRLYCNWELYSLEVSRYDSRQYDESLCLRMAALSEAFLVASNVGEFGE